MARGETPDDAARIARTEFNGARLEALLGTLRQAHWSETPPPGPSRAFSLDSLLIDLRHTLRALRATPSFTIGALLVLALGTGATTAIFSVVDAVVLRPLPFPDADRIVALGERGDPNSGGKRGPTGGTPGPRPMGGGPGPKPIGGMPGAKPGDPDALGRIEPQNYLDWAAQQRVFESIAAVADAGESHSTARRRTASRRRPPGDGGLLRGAAIAADVGRGFRVTLRGRGQRSRCRPESRVFAARVWRRPLGRWTHAALNGESYEIVAVMPPGFTYPVGAIQPAETWVPYVRPRPSACADVAAQSTCKASPG